MVAYLKIRYASKSVKGLFRDEGTYQEIPECGLVLRLELEHEVITGFSSLVRRWGWLCASHSVTICPPGTIYLQ